VELLSLFLGILGIILTILLSEPILRLIRKGMSNVERRKWSARQYRLGNVYNRRHFGFENWHVDAVVDRDGSISYTFEARIINLGDQILKSLYIPFFTDAKRITLAEINPWAASGKIRLPTKIANFDPRGSQGRIEFQYVPPLQPRERRWITWGLTLPRVFGEGDDYYNWAVEVPYYEMGGQFRFDKSWEILYAHWEASEQVRNGPIIKKNNDTLQWQVLLPEPGTVLHMKLGLARRSTQRLI
jgi:hypothetical protein